MEAAQLTSDIVMETLALPGWVAKKDGNRTVLNHPQNTHGRIVIDWEMKTINYLINSFTLDDLGRHYEKYGAPSPDDFNTLRLLVAESRAISDMKNPRRHYTSLNELFKAMDARAEAGEGTAAVYGCVWHDIDGFDKWAWVLIEWTEEDTILKYFESAVSDLNEARELGNRISAKRAQNKIDFLTRAGLSDHWLKVGELTQAGWQWNTEASLMPKEVLDELGGDVEYDRVRCGGCGFVYSLMWRLGYTGHFVSVMHDAYEHHKRSHPGCEGDIR